MDRILGQKANLKGIAPQYSNGNRLIYLHAKRTLPLNIQYLVFMNLDESLKAPINTRLVQARHLARAMPHVYF